MADQQPAAAATDKPKSKDLVKVRAIGRILIAREKGEDGATLTETYAEPGQVFELPRAEAEKLANRSFEGYPSTRDSKWRVENGVQISGGATCGPMPVNGGLIKDPQVEFVH